MSRLRRQGERWYLGGGWDVFDWSIDPVEVDPTVWTSWEGAWRPLAPEREPLSGFLIHFALSEAIIGASYELRSRKLLEPQLRSLMSGLSPVPLQPARWPSDPTYYYVGEDLLAWAEHHHDGTWSIKAGAKHPSALRPLQGLAAFNRCQVWV